MKLLNLILTVFLFVNILSAQNKVFIGLNSAPFSINGGFECTMPLFKKNTLFIRPSFDKKIIDIKSNNNTFSYINVPIGLQLLIKENPGADVGSKVDFSIGTYMGYAISGRYYPSNNLPSRPIKFGSGANADFAALDFGYFLNTQLTLGGVFGFGLSIQRGIVKHDRSKLGIYATSTKSYTVSQVNVNLFFILKNKKSKGKS